MMYSHSDQSYARMCPSCGWVHKRAEWDESPSIAFCPSCGIEMEKMACAHCGGPIAIVPRQVGNTIIPVPAPSCPWCGDSPMPREPKMRKKPAKKPVVPHPQQDIPKAPGAGTVKQNWTMRRPPEGK